MKHLLAGPIGSNKAIVPAREQTELSVAQKLFVSGSESQLLKIHILAGCLEGFGMETTLLSGRNDTLHGT